MAIQKFVFLDPVTGLYKEQTGTDGISVPDGQTSSEAVNKGQLDAAFQAAQLALDGEISRAQAAEAAELLRATTAEAGLAADIAAEAARALAAEQLLSMDLATEIARAQSAEQALTTDLAAEVVRATAAELALGVRIDVEEAARIAAVSAEEAARIAAIGVEADARLAGDLAEQAARIAAVSAEQTRAEAAEASLAADITAEAAARIAAVTAEETRAMAAEATLSADLAAEITARGVAVAAEETRALAAEAALSGRLDTLEADDTTVNSVRYLIANLSTQSTAALNAEIAARIAADDALGLRIDGEISDRQAAVAGVAADLVAETFRAEAMETAISQSLTAETAARESADQTITGNLNLLSSGLINEIARAQAAETVLQGNIDTVSAGLAQELLDRASGDAATLASAQQYADGIASGLKFKESVRAAFTTTVEWAEYDWTFPAQFGDFKAQLNSDLSAGDRILITGGQSGAASADAGIYVVAQDGVSLVRASDMAVGSDVSGAYVYVEEFVWPDDGNNQSPAGDNNNPPGVAFVCSNTKNSDIVGTSALSFVVFSRMEQLTFNTGIKKVGNTVMLDVDGNGGALDANPFDNKLRLKISDPTHLAIEPAGLKLQGALVGGSASNADAEHAHSAVTVVMASSVMRGYVTTTGADASYDAPHVFGFVRQGDGFATAEVVLSGFVSSSQLGQMWSFVLAGLTDGDTVYLGSNGILVSDFASIPSGKYAIPVGVKCPSGLLVKIGTALLKA
jgi:hypothetical protein